MQDDDDNDDPMIINIRAKNHTSERTIVPWTVIFMVKFPKIDFGHNFWLESPPTDLNSWASFLMLFSGIPHSARWYWGVVLGVRMISVQIARTCSSGQTCGLSKWAFAFLSTFLFSGFVRFTFTKISSKILWKFWFWELPPLSLSQRSLFQDLQISPFHLILEHFHEFILKIWSGYFWRTVMMIHLQLNRVFPTSWSAGDLAPPAQKIA